MPTYVYQCRACNATFEITQSLADHDAATPNCPECGSAEVGQTPAPFIAKTAKKS